MRTRGIFQPYLSDYNNSKFVLKTSCQEVFWKYQIGKGKEIILSDSSCIIQGARRPRNSHFCKFTDKTCVLKDNPSTVAFLNLTVLFLCQVFLA